MKSSIFILLTEEESDLCVADAFDECLGSRMRLQFQGVPAHGDITVSRINVSGVSWPQAKNLAGTIKTIIKEESDRTHEFEMRDIIAVAQLTDLDGAYIPDAAVILGEKLRYLPDHIETPRPDDIKRRNQEKRRRMDMLRAWQSIRLTRGAEVPYRLFYDSRNLEHALHGEAGDLTPPQKRDLSENLSEHAIADPGWFHELVTSPPVLHGHTEYHASWDWAAQGLNSLSRGSNIGLLPQEFGLEWKD